MSSTCLVTGGAGFIGSHIAHRLVDDGLVVRVVDNLSTGDIRNLAPLRGKVEFLEGDLTNPETCRRAVDGVDRAGGRALGSRGQRHRAHNRPGIVDPGLSRPAGGGTFIEVVPGFGKGIRGAGAHPPADAGVGHPSSPKRRLNKDIRAKSLRVHSAQ